jgi:hypothetical protein
MNYPEQILEAKKNIQNLEDKFLKMKKIISTLKVGDTVYEEGTHGGWDMEYYPQVILEIDHENAKLFVHEKSINQKKWVSGFHLLDKKKQKYICHY